MVEGWAVEVAEVKVVVLVEGWVVAEVVVVGTAVVVMLVNTLVDVAVVVALASNEQTEDEFNKAVEG